MKKIAVVLGTRPEAIKCAPIIMALRDDDRFEPIVVSTGQHRGMLDETMESFGLHTDVDLGVMTPRQTLTQVTSKALSGLDEWLAESDVDAVTVHGDTATTAAGALAAFHYRVPLIHIEAGLRSGDLHSPFPEEANRRLVGQLAQLHLAPTPTNAANLIREGVAESTVVVTGNTVVDALLWASSHAPEFTDPALHDLDEETRPVVLASAHRRESWDLLPEIGTALRQLADNGVRVIVPLHRNPVVRERLLPEIEGHPSITVTDPLRYLEFCRLMRRADIVLSDSSGAEEEGPALGKPTLVLRDISERQEALEAGAARLVGRSTERIVEEVTRLISDEAAYREMTDGANPYGDGQATERSVDAIARLLYGGPAVIPFVPGAEVPEPAVEEDIATVTPITDAPSASAGGDDDHDAVA